MGTSRAKKGWPPKELVVSEDHTFNDLFWCVDDHGTVTMKWIDNNIVFMVSTIHNVTDKFKRGRRRPRQTATNKNHVKEVWGQNAKVDIEIPRVIDDYNHWMGGVDLADQRISYYAAFFDVDVHGFH